MSKISWRTKKIKTSRHFKKRMRFNMHVKKVYVGLKRKKQARNLRKLVDFKRKKQDCLQVFYSYHETKLFGVYFNHVSCINKYFHLENSINTKKFSFMIAIENLKTILFFPFKIDQFYKVSSLFFSFESDINFLSMHFLKCLLVSFLNRPVF
jgi:hypothetical protein